MTVTSRTFLEFPSTATLNNVSDLIGIGETGHSVGGIVSQKHKVAAGGMPRSVEGEPADGSSTAVYERNIVGSPKQSIQVPANRREHRRRLTPLASS